MKTLPLVALIHEGPQARAYLSVMRRAGFRPSRIVHMVLDHDPIRKRPIGRWLPRSMRIGYARSRQELTQLHWPRQIRRTHAELVDRMAAQLGSLLDDAPGVIDEITGSYDYTDYADHVDPVLVSGLKDPALGDVLAVDGPTTVLFTGGGIVPKTLLSVEGLRFLHVHPGHLPQIRGADGLMWSTFVRGCPGASCFYMAPGIDVGSIVAARDFPALRFDLTGMTRPDDDTLYRALFSFYDPLLRAALLIEDVLPLGEQAPLDDLPAQTQDLSLGLTYHFIHKRLRQVGLEQLFQS